MPACRGHLAGAPLCPPEEVGSAQEGRPPGEHDWISCWSSGLAAAAVQCWAGDAIWGVQQCGKPVFGPRATLRAPFCTLSHKKNKQLLLCDDGKKEALGWTDAERDSKAAVGELTTCQLCQLAGEALLDPAWLAPSS